MITRPINILIIEDDPVIAQVYSRALLKAGYATEIMTDGSDGFHALHAGSFDLLLLDIMLPQLNGVDILKKIRAQKRFEEFPVIVLTNIYLHSVFADLQKAKANYIFSKTSVTPKEVVKAIDVLLQPNLQTGLAGVRHDATTLQSRVAPVQPDPVPFKVPPIPPVADCLSMSNRPSVPEAKSSTSQLQLPATQNISPANPLPKPAKTKEAELDDALSQLEKNLNTLCRIPGALISQENSATDQIHRQLYAQIHVLTGLKSTPYPHITEFATMLEAMMLEMHEYPEKTTSAMAKTLAQGIDGLIAAIRKRETFRPRANRDRQIAVIENDKNLRLFIKLALTKMGVKDRFFESGNEAEANFQQEVYDVIVMNATFLTPQGNTLCSRIRMKYRNRDTPIVFVTSDDSLPLWALCLAEGGSYVARNPTSVIEFAVRIGLVLMAPVQRQNTVPCRQCRFTDAVSNRECQCALIENACQVASQKLRIKSTN
jgi:DNA-binding response OmpR family regulator